MSILNYIEKIKRENESPRITAQEPRNMYAGGQLVQNTADGSRPGYNGRGGKKTSKVKTKKFPVKRQFYNRRTGKLETLYFKGQPTTKFATPLPKSKYPKFKKLYKEQHPFKTMGKKLGVSYDVLKDLEEDLIDSEELTKRKLSRVPSYAKESTVQRAAKVVKMKDYLKKEIKKFNKTKILPGEKYPLNGKALMKKFNILSHGTLNSYLDDVDNLEKLDYERPIKSRTLTDKQIAKYKKQYKNKPISLIAREITGKSAKNIETIKILAGLNRLRDNLIDQKLIDPKDIAERPKVPFKFTKTTESASQYLQKQVDLAAKEKGLISDPKYFSKKGPFKGKFNPQTFDRELLKLLNMDTVAGSLDPKFPYWAQPSFEHVEGITPGHIIGDSKALRAVTLATKRYNLQEMGMKSNLYKDVKDYLRVAVKALDNKEFGLADDSIKVVNQVYDKVSEKFPNLNRKDLPNYSIKTGIVKEVNLKGLINPQKIEESFKIYFKNVADTVKPHELKTIKRVQPNAFKVIDLFQKGKVNEGYNFIKSRMPSVKGGGKFAVPILAGGAALNFLTSPAEAAETGVVDKAKSWPIEHPWLTGGAAVGATASTPAGRKLLGKIAGGGFGPTGMVGLWSGFGGVDVKDPWDRAGVAGEALLAPTIVKGTEAVTKGIKNPLIRKGIERALNLGMTLPMATRVARFTSPIGLISLAGEGIYHAGKKEMAKREQMNPEELKQYMLEKQSRGWSRMKKAGGGMVGIRKPNAIPPEKQGLRSIMIDGMDD